MCPLSIVRYVVSLLIVCLYVSAISKLNAADFVLFGWYGTE